MPPDAEVNFATPSSFSRQPPAVERRLIMYLVASVCPRVINFCKQRISKRKFWISAKFMTNTLCILEMINFWCRSRSERLTFSYFNVNHYNYPPTESIHNYIYTVRLQVATIHQAADEHLSECSSGLCFSRLLKVTYIACSSISKYREDL